MAMSSASLRGHGQLQRRRAGSAVVVTGAAGGIGLSIVHRLLSDGWNVWATDLDRLALQTATIALPGASAMRKESMDVSSLTDVKRVASLIRHEGVCIAGLVNVAGVLQDVTPFLDMDEAAHRRLWDVNYFGSQHCLRAFSPLMMEGGGGSIVNITSVNEVRPLPLFAYGPSKVALGALTQLVAGELGPHGIRVNSVAPGFTLTPIFREKLASGKRSAATLEAHSALERMVEPDEVAAAVSFLMSDDASAITGICLPVDAGWLCSSHWMNMRELANPSFQQQEQSR